MAVASTTRKQQFTLDGVTAAFTFTFRALTSAPSDISALVTTAGVDTNLTYTTDYTIAINANGIGGTLTLVAPSSWSGTLTIYRSTTNLQSSDYDNYNQFPADTVETDFDIRTMVSQETVEALSRTLTLSISSSGVSATLPSPVGSDLLGWNAAGTAIVNYLPNTGAYLTLATQAQAQAGTDNTAYMTALRTAQAITALAPAAIASNVPGKNLIINGNFDIWQRGTSLVTAGTGTYIADRWMLSYAGTVRGDMTQDTSVPTVGTTAILSNYSLKFSVTTTDSTIAATDSNVISQQIEGYNFLPIAQKAFTLSFWVKSSLTGIYCASFTNSGTDRSYVVEYTINVANTWEKKTINVTASPSAGTWNYTTGIGLYVKFSLSAGSNYQTTANAWQTGNYTATANQVNHSATSGNTFFISQVQVEVGSTATNFELRQLSTELMLCQRYYWKTFSLTTAPAQNTGSRLSSLQYAASLAGIANEGMQVRFPVSMRTTPTITFYNPNAANAKWRNATGGADSGAASTDALGSEGFFVINAQAVGDLTSNVMSIHADATAEL